ncbi:autotransporter outer membrane beta-barrel domain-containing protein [Aurantimonas sp. 22II-16-19i]|uniref:autotransporter outer membrane beta-barrel domain-containing protein n=1 Tax=Aurantimonas sp. 22II-16-19i TaxID=1317114 RepID=UPI0009F7C5FE|nr:autotransporter outer membrane beta-barrel domain-containing protein [Aurantimonas sp. 22II-16-19i]ORE98033.1 hemagglutinin [Aurantimonas sp. 22II-16-19i]
MQINAPMQTRPGPAPTPHGKRRRRAAGIVSGVAAAAMALPIALPADADGLDDASQSVAVAAISRQNALALRLTSGQTNNIKTHLEGLRKDACGPVAVRLSLGQTSATEDWERLITDADDASRWKTLQTATTTDRCANTARAWTGGSLTLSNDGPDASGRGFERVESSLAAGLDARLDADLAVGLALGVSNGDTIENQGKVRGRAALGSLAAYASYHPSEASFAEAAVGIARLDLSDRVDGGADDVSAGADPDAFGGFATVSVGRLEQIGSLRVSPYLKAAGQMVRLAAARQEIGSSSYRTGGRYSASLAGTIGIDASLALRRLPDWIAVTPKAGVEVGYSLNRQSAAAVTAAAGRMGGQSAGPVAGSVPGSFSTNRTLSLDVGTSVRLFDELSLDLDVETRPIENGRPKTLRLSSSWSF